MSGLKRWLLFAICFIVIICAIFVIFARAFTTPERLIESKANEGELLQKYHYSETGTFCIFYDEATASVTAIDINKSKNAFIDSYIRGCTKYSLSGQQIVEEDFKWPNYYADIRSDRLLYGWSIALPYMSGGSTHFRYLTFGITQQSSDVPLSAAFEIECDGMYLFLDVRDEKPVYGT